MFLWIILIPIIWLLVAKYWLRTSFNYKELGISILATLIITGTTYGLGMMSQTDDTEIWNGYVTKKERKHGQYTESYRCNCYTTCSGSGSKRTCSEHCSTCYREHYTVKWNGYTTVGNFSFKSLDRTSRSVYNTPDPSSYTVCKIDEPASIEHSYTNYVKAVPDSLFHDDSKIAEQFAGKIPSYPKVYGFYRFNHVINVDSKIKNIDKFNEGISDALKTLGAAKQANIIVILTEIDDPTYRYAIEKEWLGAKKNDIIIMVGLDGNKITWVDIMTWALNSGNELFHVTMRDGLLEQKTLDAKKFVPFVSQTVSKLYDRPQMKDYEYLKDEIEPPTWVIILAIILAFGTSIGLTFYFHRNEI